MTPLDFYFKLSIFPIVFSRFSFFVNDEKKLLASVFSSISPSPLYKAKTNKMKTENRLIDWANEQMFMNRTQRVIYKTNDCNLSDDDIAGMMMVWMKRAKNWILSGCCWFSSISCACPFVVFYSRWQSNRNNQLHGNNGITMRICYECHVYSRTLVSEKRKTFFFISHSLSLLCSSPSHAIDGRRRFISFRCFQHSLFFLLVITVVGMRHTRVHSRWFTLPHKTESRVNMKCLVKCAWPWIFFRGKKKAPTHEWNILSSEEKKWKLIQTQ